MQQATNIDNYALKDYSGDFQTDLRAPQELKPNPANPRGIIDDDTPEIQSLARDIRERGLIQPIVITPENLILAGHRRHRASLIAGIEFVPVVIRILRPGEFAEDFFLAENAQRQDLSPLEEARAIFALMRKLEKTTKKTVTRKDLARRLNMNAITISERLSILQFSDRVQLLFHHAELPLGSATKLLKLIDFPEEIEKFADRMVTRQVTLNSLDALIARRLPELEKNRDNEATLARHSKLEKIKRIFPENSHPKPPMTRNLAMENLRSNSAKQIDLFKVQVLFDQTCCNCGMMGNESVCLNCPLPKFINGICGRASAGVDYGNNSGDDFDE